LASEFWQLSDSIIFTLHTKRLMSLQQTKIYYHPGKYVEHYYLCNYRPHYVGGDRLSRSLLRFKEALSHDLQAWIDCAVSELQQVDMPCDVIIIRALSNEETIIDNNADTALDKLGRAIGKKFNLNWMPALIVKSKLTRPLKLLASAERWIEMKDVYQLSSPNLIDLNNKRFLLIDDIVTTGATVISVIKMMKLHFPGSKFKVFTLAKSAYDYSLNASMQLAGTAYAWEGNSGWMVAEDETHYDSYAELSACIHNDDFSNS